MNIKTLTSAETVLHKLYTLRVLSLIKINKIIIKKTPTQT